MVNNYNVSFTNKMLILFNLLHVKCKWRDIELHQTVGLLTDELKKIYIFFLVHYELIKKIGGSAETVKKVADIIRLSQVTFLSKSDTKVGGNLFHFLWTTRLNHQSRPTTGQTSEVDGFVNGLIN